MTSLLDVRALKVHFPIGRGLFRKPHDLKAVDGVSFKLASGETLGIVGESGCGKSTLARAVLQLVRPTGGRVLWLGDDLVGSGQKELGAFRREAQMIFQDPLASLDPRMPIGEIVAEPLRTHRRRLGREAIAGEVAQALEVVGLHRRMVNRYPHEFSGGQCQRIGIARALVLKPRLLVCDEPVSALDVSIQAQIINLLAELQRANRLAMLFISHNLAVVRHVSRRIMVLYLGRVVEIGDRDTLFAAPRHPYTKALIAAVPEPDPAKERGKSRVLLQGELPSPLDPPSGCVFRTRCPLAAERCAAEVPRLRELGPGQEVACHFA